MKKQHYIMAAMLLAVSLGMRGEYRDHRNRKTDSLEAVLNSHARLSDENLMGAYIDLMNGYRNTDAQRSALFARKVLALSYKMNALNAREGALYNLGLLAYGADDYATATDYFNRALALTDSMRTDKRYGQSDIDDNLSQLYGALGNLYNMQDMALLAIEYYQRALPIFECHGWLESQSVLYHNVGELYLSMNNDAKATENYERALQTALQSGDSLIVAMSRKGLGKLYVDHDYDRAAAILMPAYDYYHAHRHEEAADYSEVLASLARLHLTDGHRDVARAKAYADEALTYASREMMTENRCDIYAAACQVAMAQKQWSKALEYGLQSVRPEGETTFGDVGSFHMLAIICMELGDKERATLYINKVRDTMKRFATEHYQAGLSQMEVLYETEKKQAAIEQLNTEKRLLARLSILGAIVLLLLATLFFLLWRSVRLGRRNATMQAKIEGEQAERVRLAHDLHDRLGARLTVLHQQMAQAGGQPDATSLQLLDEVIGEMRNVAHHLLPDSLQRYGLRVALRDFCSTMKNVSFSFVGEDEHIAHEATIYCIVHELVNNAVRHAHPQQVRVQMIADSSYTAINVSDDGDGGATLDSPDGTGLRSLCERVEGLGGRFDLYSKAGEGTEVNIELPK